MSRDEIARVTYATIAAHVRVHRKAGCGVAALRWLPSVSAGTFFYSTWAPSAGWVLGRGRWGGDGFRRSSLGGGATDMSLLFQ